MCLNHCWASQPQIGCWTFDLSSWFNLLLSEGWCLNPQQTLYWYHQTLPRNDLLNSLLPTSTAHMVQCLTQCFLKPPKIHIFVLVCLRHPFYIFVFILSWTWNFFLVTNKLSYHPLIILEILLMFYTSISLMPFITLTCNIYIEKKKKKNLQNAKACEM